MKSIIYAFLFLTLPISMAGKDSTAIKADSPAATKAAKQEEPKTPPAPSIVKHDTVYVAVKEMPGESIWTVFSIIISLIAVLISLVITLISRSTLKEMKEQRLAEYKPILTFQARGLSTVIENTDFRINDYKIHEGGLKELTTRVINLGQGSAIDLQIKIIAEKEKFIHLYNLLKDKIPIEVLSIREGNEGFNFYHKNICHKWNFIVSRLIEFVLPEMSPKTLIKSWNFLYSVSI